MVAGFQPGENQNPLPRAAGRFDHHPPAGSPWRPSIAGLQHAALQRRRPRMEPAQRLDFHLQSFRHYVRPQLLQQSAAGVSRTPPHLLFRSLADVWARLSPQNARGWLQGWFYGPLRRFEVSIYPERLKGRFTAFQERSRGGSGPGGRPG